MSTGITPGDHCIHAIPDTLTVYSYPPGILGTSIASLATRLSQGHLSCTVQPLYDRQLQSTMYPASTAKLLSIEKQSEEKETDSLLEER